MTSKNVTLKKAKNEQIINGLDQEIIATDAILSDLQLSKSRADAEHAQQQKIAAERKRAATEAIYCGCTKENIRLSQHL